ncbi:hypothetical protein F4827_000945 [Paraburkholderia bannensis]|uniref:DUF2239 family protein n=1 Tax=Paraburkholderia bannensis TaxID=765414 RepID=A0A7W9TTT1_9BURK|nr:MULTISPECIES: DUF2239 family protein [Paraburkholderia]MBB3256119.1 hypothetical protein [Paraburkholderia sp. WP4_3_2]MBB6101119.1 hypothetical protein [Paraburkholderia bannensis]
MTATSTQAPHGAGVTAFAGTRLIARGAPLDVALAVKAALEQGESASMLVFDDRDATQVEFDLRGRPADVAARLAADAAWQAKTAAASETATDTPGEALNDDTPRGRGRPKLGVVAREVTLLPRHWDWLAAQPGGASVVLRKLVDNARHASEAKDRVRTSREAVHRFMTALAGNLPGYEEALRALYAGERARFEAWSVDWPEGVRDYVRELAQGAFA